MKKIRAAVVGYGNIGRFALEALEAAPDLQASCAVTEQRTSRQNWHSMTW